MLGPKAPKDPVAKRPAMYILVDTVIEGSPRGNGKFQDICYLNGRIVQKITVLCDKVDQEILKLVPTCAGFRKLVHSVGVTVTATKKENLEERVSFALHSLTKVPDREGTTYTLEVPCNGKEEKLLVSDFPENDTDDILGSFVTTFKEHETAKLTVCFYLNDGYTVPEITPDPPVDFKSSAYKKMIERSLLSTGNTERFQKAVEKAGRGEDVTIAYLGGSITQGAGAKPIHTESYAYQSFLAFKEMYGKGNGENVHLIKSGAGGTSSELGITRYELDILRKGTVKPDVLFIEYAVNDAGDETDGICYESLVLKAMEGPGNPAVVLLFAVFMDNFTLEERLIPIGKRYDLPMISLRSAVTAQFTDEKPVLTKRQYFYDLFHPSNTGHRIMADCIINYFMAAQTKPTENCDMQKAAFQTEQNGMQDTVLNNKKVPAIGDTFKYLKTFDRSDYKECRDIREISFGAFTEIDTILQCVEKDDNMAASPEFPDNWKKPVDAKNEPFRLKLFCRDVLLVYKDSGESSFGAAEIKVDGKTTKEISPLEVGWTHCNAYIVFKSEKAAEHVIEIAMKTGNEQKSFTILGVSYTTE